MVARPNLPPTRIVRNPSGRQPPEHEAVLNVEPRPDHVPVLAFGDKFRPSPPGTPSEDYSEFINFGVPSMFFNIGVYEPEHVAVVREDGPLSPANHCPCS